MKEIINKWLSGKRGYAYGCILYRKYGHDETLKDLFDKGQTPYTKEKLLSSLQHLVSDEVKEIPAASIAEMPDSNDKIAQALKNEWMPKYTQMNYLRHQLDIHLDDLSEEADIVRGKYAQQILQLEKECMALWMQRDYYTKNGSLPVKEKKEVAPVINDFIAGTRSANLKIYIRRYKLFLKNNPGNASFAEKLMKYEKELTQINKYHGKSN